MADEGPAFLGDQGERSFLVPDGDDDVRFDVAAEREALDLERVRSVFGLFETDHDVPAHDPTVDFSWKDGPRALAFARSSLRPLHRATIRHAPDRTARGVRNCLMIGLTVVLTALASLLAHRSGDDRR